MLNVTTGSATTNPQLVEILNNQFNLIAGLKLSHSSQGHFSQGWTVSLCPQSCHWRCLFSFIPGCILSIILIFSSSNLSPHRKLDQPVKLFDVWGLTMRYWGLEGVCQLLLEPLSPMVTHNNFLCVELQRCLLYVQVLGFPWAFFETMVAKVGELAQLRPSCQKQDMKLCSS